MNWLAHVFLSQPSGEHRLGNLLGDLVKGKKRAKLDSRFDLGLQCHIQIDRFTDTHDLVRASKRRISREHSRYSGVLIDVFYDYFLARNWHLYSQVDLTIFTQQVYFSLLEHLNLIPARARMTILVMIEQDWLGSYSSLAGVEATLYRIQRKLSIKHQNSFQVADFLTELEINHQELERHFLLFFPEIMKYLESSLLANDLAIP